MALKLDDLLVKKKEPVQILDLSKSSANSKEELKKLLEKVPEYKIKMDKVRLEDVKVYDKKFSFKTSKKEEKVKAFPFANPVPSEMKSLRLEDLCSVDIQWKMLTSLRPKVKLDEEYFSKLIDLGKLQLSSREKEKKHPISSFIRKSKNKAGILETRILSCRDCGEEFCKKEICHVFAYESYERLDNQPTTLDELAAGGPETSKGEKKRKRKPKKLKKKSRLKKKSEKLSMASKSTPDKSSTVQKPVRSSANGNPLANATKVKKVSASKIHTQKLRKKLNNGHKVLGSKPREPSKTKSKAAAKKNKM